MIFPRFRGTRLNGFLSVLAAFATSRLLCSAFVYLGHARRPFLTPVAGGWEGVANWWLNPWTTYDSAWYLGIALHGYDAQAGAFFPLYPWLLRLFANDQISAAWTGVVISHLALLAALYLLFLLTEFEWNRPIAHLTVWILAYIPAAPFWGAVYTESTFLLLLVATFLAARKEKWWLAGCMGALAALCRNPGLLIAAALFMESKHASRAENTLGRRLAWVLPAISFITIQTVLWLEFHDPLTGATAHIYRALEWPWLPLLGDVSALATEPHSFVFTLATVSGLFFTIIPLLLPLCARPRLRPGYLLLATGITLMNLTYAYQISPQTISATRYMAPIFPVSQIIAVTIASASPSRKPLVFAGIYLFLFIFSSYFFGMKRYLG